MSRIATRVGYELGRGWVVRIEQIDSIGAVTNAELVCATRWGARRYARKWQRKLDRLDRRGDLR